MFITKKCLSRRTVLRGMGAAFALPFLESMVPAATPLAQTAARPRTRFGAIYFPHGATMDKWTPAAEGSAFEFSEILQPLKPFKDRVNVISDLSHPQAYGGGSATSNHTRSAAAFLSGAQAKAGTQAYLGITTSGFPNLFMLYGPNTNNGSIITMIEAQVEHVLAHVRRLAGDGIRWVDVKPDAMRRYNDEVQEGIAGVEVWQAACNGYYRAPSGRVVTQWPWSMAEFQRRAATIDLDAFEFAGR